MVFKKFNVLPIITHSQDFVPDLFERSFSKLLINQCWCKKIQLLHSSTQHRYLYSLCILTQFALLNINFNWIRGNARATLLLQLYYVARPLYGLQGKHGCKKREDKMTNPMPKRLLPIFLFSINLFPHKKQQFFFFGEPCKPSAKSPAHIR